MIKRTIISLVSILVLGSIACNGRPASPCSQSQPPSSSFSPVSVTQSPTRASGNLLSWLLKVVPKSDIAYLDYNDIPALSAYQNLIVPSRRASPDEKLKWWTAISIQPPLGDFMPRASAIIDSVNTSIGPLSFILMANTSPQNDVLQVKTAIQLALKAYQDKATVAYQSGGMADLAISFSWLLTRRRL